ncbi:MAG: GFA family protein [Algicola sp.]|nr:GFA family protein [Algicola sp.]
MNSIHGSCLCGEVTFTYQPPSLWSAHCHCSLCQKAHGAAFVTWVGFNEQRMQISASDGALRWYASTPQAQRGFCHECGSTLFFRSSRWPGEIHVVRANINSKVDLQPKAHVYWDTHVNWFEFEDELARKVT